MKLGSDLQDTGSCARCQGTVLCGVFLRHWGEDSHRGQALLPPSSGLALRAGNAPHACPGTSNLRALPWAGVNLCRAPALQTKASPEGWRRPPSAGGVGGVEERKALEIKVREQGAARRVPFPCSVGPSPLHGAALGIQLLTPLCRERRAGTGWGQN